MDLEGVRIFEASIAFEGGNKVPAKLGFDDFHFSGHDRLRPEDQVRHQDAVFYNVTTPVKRALAEAAEVEDRFAQHFAGNGAGMHADSANGPLAVDDRDFLAGWAAADYHEIVFVSLHSKFVSLLYTGPQRS